MDKIDVLELVKTMPSEKQDELIDWLIQKIDRKKLLTIMSAHSIFIVRTK